MLLCCDSFQKRFEFRKRLGGLRTFAALPFLCTRPACWNGGSKASFDFDCVWYEVDGMEICLSACVRESANALGVASGVSSIARSSGSYVR